MRQVAEDLGDAVKVLKVDTDENQALATQLQVPPNPSAPPPPCTAPAALAAAGDAQGRLDHHEGPGIPALAQALAAVR